MRKAPFIKKLPGTSPDNLFDASIASRGSLHAVGVFLPLFPIERPSPVSITRLYLRRRTLELDRITDTGEVPQPLGIFNRHTGAAVADRDENGVLGFDVAQTVLRGDDYFGRQRTHLGLSGAGIGSFAATRNDHSKARSSVQKKPLRALLSLMLCVARFPISVKELELTWLG